MTDDRIKDYQDRLGQLRDQNASLAKSILLKKDNIKKESQTISVLERYHRKQEYLLNMHVSVPQEAIKLMSEDQYRGFTALISSSGVSGNAAYIVYDETQQAAYKYEQHYTTASSLDAVAANNASTLVVISKEHPELFPEADRITKEYQIEDEIDTHIDSINIQLKKDFPEVYTDFDAFIRKYKAFSIDKSQYQDLMGVRSSLFFKLIFDFSKRTYGVEFPRIDAIRKFVFGIAPPIPSIEPLLESCNALYRELSNQDATGMSAKLGKVTSAYVEGVFRRIVGNMAALLEVRSTYFQP